MTIRFIPRDNLKRADYVRLGLPKSAIRRATTNWAGRPMIDCTRLAELTGKSEIAVVTNAERAKISLERVALKTLTGIDKAGLKRIREILEALKLISDKGIKWADGLKHPDIQKRKLFQTICLQLIEELAQKADVPVLALTTVHFHGQSGIKVKAIELDGIGRSLSGFYDYYYNSEERNSRKTIEFMFDSLRIPRFSELSLEGQLDTIRAIKKINTWKFIPISTQRYLIEKLAQKAKVTVWALTSIHFIGDSERGINAIELEEIGQALDSLYHYYYVNKERNNQNIIEFMFYKLGIQKFPELSLEKQLEVMKSMKWIPWSFIPIATQRHLIERLAQKADIPTQALTACHFRGRSLQGIKAIELEEIGQNLSGLYCYYTKSKERKKQDVIEFMFKTLGIQRLSELSLEKQLEVMKSMNWIPWSLIPISTQRYLVEKLAQKAGVTVWALNAVHFHGESKRGIKAIELEEIEQTLDYLYQLYRVNKERNNKDVIEFMLQIMGYGLPPFNVAGRLFASSQAEHLTQSKFIQLTTTREVVKDWLMGNSNSFLTAIKLSDIETLLVDPKYKGLKNIFGGMLVNCFGLSYIDLICLAFQHVCLDELIPGYRKEHPDAPNYLQPIMFEMYKYSSAETAIPERVIGSYRNIGIDGKGKELALLIELLGKKISSVQDQNRSIPEESQFSPKWLETQRRGLEGIKRSVEEKQALPAPLIYALGMQGDLPDIQPKLAGVSAVSKMKLNPAQALAARLILEDSNPLVTIHGPAGSGKTRTLVQTIEKLVREGKKALYITPTHNASDLFLERVDRSALYVDIPVLRLGVSGTELSEKAKEYWVRDPKAREEFRKKRQEGKGCLFIGTIAGGVHFLTDPGAKVTRESLFSEKVDRNLTVTRDLSEYDVVIIDEASMASKPEVYSALALATRAVIVGDHVQLEPFPVAREIVAEMKLNDHQRETVERSLLEQLMFENYPHVLLDVNYRAINPVMIVLASRIFYDERIKINHDTPYFALPKEERQKQYPADSLKIIDTSGLPTGRKAEFRSGTSFSNPEEADLVIKEVKKYLSQGFKLEDIAIISPYKAQVELIKIGLRKALPSVSDDYINRWVSTFDGFQGDENKCVILSFVRSNEKQPPETGFVGNYHRVNVGITRAQERMTLIGDWATLKKTGNGSAEQAELSDVLSLQTRYIFEELEEQVKELAEEGRAVIERLV